SVGASNTVSMSGNGSVNLGSAPSSSSGSSAINTIGSTSFIGNSFNAPLAATAIAVNSGVLDLAAGGIVSATYTVAPVATLGFSAGTRPFLAGGVTGGGDVNFSGGTVTFSPAIQFNPGGLTTVSGGIVTFNNAASPNNFTQTGGSVLSTGGGSLTV